MQLGFWKAPQGNFGDDLNLWLWPRLLPGRFTAVSDTVFIGIGSILDHRFDRFPRKIVLGAGARSQDSVPALDPSWRVLAVRGPLTAAALGIAPELAATDPAILVRKWVSKVPGRDTGLVPYFEWSDAWKTICASCSFRLIPPTLPVEAFLEAIRGCSRILSESLHGAIVADALRIPWFPLRCLNRRIEGDTHLFKWRDWCGSLGIEFKELELPPLWTPETPSSLAKLRAGIKARWIAHLLKAHAARGEFLLSPSEIVDERMARLLRAVDVLRDGALFG